MRANWWQAEKFGCSRQRYGGKIGERFADVSGAHHDS